MNNLTKRQVKKWIIASFLGFFIAIVGLPFAIINSIIDYKYLPYKNKAILHCGVTLIGVSTLFTTWTTIVSLNIGQNPFIISSLYIGGILQGIYTCIFYLIHTRRANKLSYLLTIITEYHITNIGEISDLMCTNYANTLKLISTAIKMKALDGASISADKREILFEKSVWAHKLCICNTCGAAIKVNFGQTLVCEYCGGKLDVKQVQDKNS